MVQITLRDYLQQTEDAIGSNRVDNALTRCQFMLSYFPEALEIQRLLGEVYLAQGRIEEAQHLFDWVLTNDPENVLAYCNCAHLSEHRAEYDVALDCYQQAYELSRGNGQIREEFNRLSERVGQKGFMFSRAGLARLYMRGDLLSEAIQEWEAVLTVSPERLDARIGLLETYWRAGHIENVEQLAEQILHDVSGCLKALLLQASIISAKDSQRSQELLRRAEALDPDHTTAQVLFADALASQPDDPFLRMLKKAPALLSGPTSQEQQPNSFAPASDPINALGSDNNIDALALWGKDAYGSSETTLVKPRSDATSASTGMSVTPLWGHEEVQNNPSHPGISLSPSTGTTLQASWNAPRQEVNTTQSSQQTPAESQEHAPEPWELLQDALNQLDSAGAEPHVATGSQTALNKEGVPLWENISGSVELSQPTLDISAPTSSPMPRQQESSSSSGLKLDPWGVPMEEPAPATDNATSPPNWLNMLSEQQAQSNASSSAVQDPAESFISAPQPLPLTPEATASPMATENAESLPSWLQSVGGAKSEEVEEEESFFGPSWLKSLGATTMAEEEAPATTASASETQTPHTAQPEYTDLQHEEYTHTPFAQHSGALTQLPSDPYQSVPSHNAVPEINPYESWSQASVNNSPQTYEQSSWTSAEVAHQSEYTNYETPSAHEDASASLPQSSPALPTEQPFQQETVPGKAEQNLLTTLEELEQSLWSKGFIPLEPNSLATLAAQTQESSVSSHDPDTLKAPEAYAVQDLQPSTSRQEPQETPETPSLSSALAQLGGMSAESPSPAAPELTTSLEMVEQNEQPSWLQALKNASAAPTVPATPAWPNAPFESSAPAAYADNLLPPPPAEEEAHPATSHTPTQPGMKELQQTVKAPAMRGNPLLDPEAELETTMRRPAVRLQSIQHQTPRSQRAQETLIVSRSSSRERIEKASKATKSANENLSRRDRLVKGYQYQLVGDYDEAMQEYRIIIRSGTDLLNEVVSNVRALLKLAPNYSAGYRVLGDAYMRQGEYLQAMEAYNKALTMTKKVKSRA
jgi:tetratricopeptide (TPR) repeat protein